MDRPRAGLFLPERSIHQSVHHCLEARRGPRYSIGTAAGGHRALTRNKMGGSDGGPIGAGGCGRLPVSPLKSITYGKVRHQKVAEREALQDSGHHQPGPACMSANFCSPRNSSIFAGQGRSDWFRLFPMNWWIRRGTKGGSPRLHAASSKFDSPSRVLPSFESHPTIAVHTKPRRTDGWLEQPAL